MQWPKKTTTQKQQAKTTSKHNKQKSESHEKHTKNIQKTFDHEKMYDLTVHWISESQSLESGDSPELFFISLIYYWQSLCFIWKSIKVHLKKKTVQRKKIKMLYIVIGYS